MDIIWYGVFELLPIAALLGASGLGERIGGHIKNIYVRIKKEGDERNEPARGRPRVQVTGPKVQPLVCQICLGRIKEGTEYVKCSSGKVFHSVCLARVGSCPFCVRTVAIKGMESTTTVTHPMRMVFLPPEQVPAPAPLPEPSLPPEAEGAMFCPDCGALLKEGATSCSCGAQFADPTGSFKCPRCGAEVREGDLSCAACGEPLDWLEPPRCPECGWEVSPEASKCEKCGTILGDRCPECGARLDEGELVCPGCGTEFDYK